MGCHVTDPESVSLFQLVQFKLKDEDGKAVPAYSATVDVNAHCLECAERDVRIALRRLEEHDSEYLIWLMAQHQRSEREAKDESSRGDYGAAARSVGRAEAYAFAVLHVEAEVKRRQRGRPEPETEP